MLQTPLGELTALPITLVGFMRPTSKGGDGRGNGRERDGRRGQGSEMGGRKRGGTPAPGPQNFESRTAPVNASYLLNGWWFGIVVNALVSINEVNLCRARLVTVSGVQLPVRGNLSQYITSHRGQLSLAIPPWVGAMSTIQRVVMLCGWGVKAGMVREWVAGKTVWSLAIMGHIWAL